MATSIPAAFAILKSNLEITGLQASVVSTRQTNVRNVLARNLLVTDLFLTGSYARNTMIAPLNEADIDIFLVLDNKYYHHYNGQNGGQAGLLDLVKRNLRTTYTRTPDISRNGQAVTIRFEDFVVDVVPSFNRAGGGYLMPDSIRKAWISTDPNKHVDIVSASNKAHNGDLVPLIKMIKGWNKSHGSFFRSFHLEVLLLEIFNNVQISNFPSGVRYYFDKARAAVARQNPDPAGYGGDIGAYIDTQEKIQLAVNRFGTAYENALRAEHFTNQGYIRPAIENWSKIFGEYFPAYG